MQANYVVRHKERVSLLDAEKMADLDYETFVLPASEAHYSRNQFCQGNRYGYYILANTWIWIASDLGGKSLGNILLANLREKGVAQVSTLLKGIADRLVSAAATAEYLYDVSTPVSIDYADIVMEDQKVQELVARVTKLPFRLARQVCVYPKRFAPIVPSRYSALHEKAINSFVEINAANCRTEYRINSMCPLVNPQVGDCRALPFHASPIDDMAVEIAKLARRISCAILGEHEGLKRRHQMQLPRFGPGACRNAGPGLLERYERCLQYGYYYPSIMPAMRAHAGLVYRPHPDTVSTYCGKNRWQQPLLRRGYWGRSKYPQFCQPMSVPKTVWANRLIAVEDVCNMSDQLHLKDDMTARFQKTVGEAIPIKNQEVNREMARFAAYTNRWATLDLSHASDSVVKALVRMLVPDSWYAAFEQCVPFGYILGHGDARVTRPLHMFATMGCGCTFNVEALMFFAVVAACVIIHSYNHRIPTSDQDLLALCREIQVYVMGDDIITPSQSAEFVIEALAYFGFEVNVDKSFIDGRFRESCGADWLSVDKCEGDGVIDVTCVYYPRIPIGRDFVTSMTRTNRDWSESEQEAFYESGLSRLIALQQRLFDLSPNASNFVLGLVQAHFPEISTSFPGEFASTLWTYTPEGEYVYNVSDLARLSSQQETEMFVLRQDERNVQACYASEALATDLLKREFEESVGRPMQIAEFPLLQRQLTWRRRRVLRLPGLRAKSSSRLTAWSAELLLYELMLTRDARADSVLPVSVSDDLVRLAEQSGRYLPLFCVRPTRLRRSQLLPLGDFTITTVV